MLAPTFRIVSIGMALALVCALAPAQGVGTKSGAVVLHGSASNTSRPATIEMDKVEKETPEYDTIKSDGVRRGSARYELLIAKMHKRIQRACKAAAEAEGHDCVVRDGDIKDARGLEVADLTEAVVEQLESDDGTP